MANNTLLTTAIGNIITALLKMFPDEDARKVIDKFIDAGETAVKESSNTIDDTICTPLFQALRRLTGTVETTGSPYEDKQ